MSNTVKTTKSDEMLKSYVAQIASQSVAIFLQQKQEAREQEVGHFEVYDELQTRLEDMEANYRSLEAVKNNLQTELKERLYELQSVKQDYTSVCDERDEVKRWWHEELSLNRELKVEIEKLREKVPVDSVEESDTEKEKEAVNG